MSDHQNIVPKPEPLRLERFSIRVSSALVGGIKDRVVLALGESLGIARALTLAAAETNAALSKRDIESRGRAF